MESKWIPMFEARYRFCERHLRFIFKNATRVTEYQHFAIYNHVVWDGPVDLSSEAFWIASAQIFIFLHTYNEILRIPCLTLIWNRAKSGSGAPGPESAPRGNLWFSLFNVRYTYNTKLKLEKSSELEVGMFSNPIHSNPIQSNPIQSNPFQSNQMNQINQ